MFRIENVERSDEAEYFCEAVNSEGSASYRVVLYVRGEYSVHFAVSLELFTN